MSDLLSGLLVGWGILNGMVLFILLLSCADGANFSFVNPIVIYKNIRVNWFGAWALSILLNILLPAIAIPYWIYKICTVGRK